jgi:hypothetical protein
MRDNQLRTVVSLSGHPGLEIIELSCNLIEQIEFNGNPPKLRALILSSNTISKIVNRYAFSLLEILNLSGNRLSEFDFTLFPHLKTLNVSFNAFTSFELNCPTLLELSIQNNNLSSFLVVNGRALTNLDFSSNSLSDISVIKKLSGLTHLNGIGNDFDTLWVSFAVSYCPSLTRVDGRLLKEADLAIHRDRVRKFNKSTRTPHPHEAISEIRLSFKRLKNIVTESIRSGRDIEQIWIARGKEEIQRRSLIDASSVHIPCVSTFSEECLTIYGFIRSGEFREVEFRTLKLAYVPIIKGNETEKRVLELARKDPTMLTLDHNLLDTMDDCIFLSAFESVQVLEVYGNEIVNMSLFRPLMAYLMASLLVVNGVAITRAEKMSGVSHFRHMLIVARNLEIETGLEEQPDELTLE